MKKVRYRVLYQVWVVVVLVDSVLKFTQNLVRFVRSCNRFPEKSKGTTAMIAVLSFKDQISFQLSRVKRKGDELLESAMQCYDSREAT
jgi:hypothetical protein